MSLRMPLPPEARRAGRIVHAPVGTEVADRLALRGLAAHERPAHAWLIAVSQAAEPARVLVLDDENSVLAIAAANVRSVDHVDAAVPAHGVRRLRRTARRHGLPLTVHPADTDPAVERHLLDDSRHDVVVIAGAGRSVTECVVRAIDAASPSILVDLAGVTSKQQRRVGRAMRAQGYGATRIKNEPDWVHRTRFPAPSGSPPSRWYALQPAPAQHLDEAFETNYAEVSACGPEVTSVGHRRARLRRARQAGGLTEVVGGGLSVSVAEGRRRAANVIRRLTPTHSSES